MQVSWVQTSRSVCSLIFRRRLFSVRNNQVRTAQLLEYVAQQLQAMFTTLCFLEFEGRCAARAGLQGIGAQVLRVLLERSTAQDERVKVDTLIDSAQVLLLQELRSRLSTCRGEGFKFRFVS